jgi:hypothetical protein
MTFRTFQRKFRTLKIILNVNNTLYIFYDIQLYEISDICTHITQRNTDKAV